MRATARNRPWRPRLSPGADIVATPEGAVVASGPRRLVLKGASAPLVASELLPRLDGGHSVEDLAAAAGMGVPQVELVLGMLDERMLLDSEPEPPGEGLTAETLTYYARHRHALGAHRDTASLLRALDRGVVLSGATGALTGLRALLTENGVRAHVATEDWAEERRGTGGEPALVVDIGPQVASAPTTPVPPGRAETPRLRVRLSGTHVEIGPYFLPSLPGCDDCIDRSRRRHGWSQTDHIGPREADVHSAQGLAAGEIVNFLAGSPLFLKPYQVRRIDLERWHSEDHWMTPYLDCRACNAEPHAEPADDEALVHAYELAQARPPLPVRTDEPVSAGRREQLRGLELVRDAFETHPRLKLPEVDPPLEGRLGDPAPAAATGFSADLLGAVLNLVAGFRSEPPGEDRRWTPSGGNLGSVEAYAIIPAGVPGLPGNRFKYMDLGHELLAVTPEPIDSASLDALTGPGFDASEYDCLVLLVSDHRRIAEKYGDFAVRLSLLDVGCASSQLHAVCDALGWDTVFAREWAPELNHELLLHRTGQAIAAVAGVRGR